MKKVAMGPKPDMKVPTTADAWVSAGISPEGDAPAHDLPANRASEKVKSIADVQVQGAPLKRLTLDIPEELHARIKSQCALRRVKMVDAIRQILDEAFTD